MGSLLDAYGIYSSIRERPTRNRSTWAPEPWPAQPRSCSTPAGTSSRRRSTREAAKNHCSSIRQGDPRIDLPEEREKARRVGARSRYPIFVPQSDQYIGESLLGYAYWPKGMIAEIKTKDAASAEKGSGTFCAKPGSSGGSTFSAERRSAERRSAERRSSQRVHLRGDHRFPVEGRNRTGPVRSGSRCPRHENQVCERRRGRKS